MSQRLDKIGELLAKGVYLYLQKEKAEKEKTETLHESPRINPRSPFILTKILDVLE